MHQPLSFLACLVLVAAAAQSNSTQSISRTHSTTLGILPSAFSTTTRPRDSVTVAQSSNAPSSTQPHTHSTKQPATTLPSHTPSPVAASALIQSTSVTQSNAFLQSSLSPSLIFSSSGPQSTSTGSSGSNVSPLFSQTSTPDTNHHSAIYIALGVLGGIFGLGAVALCLVTSRGNILRKLGFGRSSELQFSDHGRSGSLDSLALQGDYLRPKEEILGSWSRREDILDPIKMKPFQRPAPEYYS
jgi:hypothetical protein